MIKFLTEIFQFFLTVFYYFFSLQQVILQLNSFNFSDIHHKVHEKSEMTLKPQQNYY